MMRFEEFKYSLESFDYYGNNNNNKQFFKERKSFETLSCSNYFTNLDPEDHYQFRVVGANMAGFGIPSEACPAIRLRPESTQFGTEAQYPPPSPSQPQIINIGTDNATIEWKNLTEGNYKYLVQYREINTLNWINAINSPIKENKFKVANLRPNGEYEFRIICLDENGKNSTSPSSGFVRIRPPAPLRNGKISSQNLNLKDLAAPEAPGKPKVLESGSNWIHLHWDTPIPSTSYDISSSSSPFDSNLAYLIEIREFGVGNSVWKQLFDRTTGGQGMLKNRIILDNLSSEFKYEFRIWTISLNNGLHSSLPSPISEPINLLNSQNDWQPKLPSLTSQTLNNKKVPERPSAPEYLEFFPTSLTLCWQPAKSSLPVQGYEIEFRDPMQDASNWYRLTTDSLIKTCKTSIGSLLCGHQYQFRILARNSVGLSQPSDPSPLVTIGGGNQGGLKETTKNNNLIPLMEEMFVRESPPLPDRDDSPPPIYRQSESSLQWRDPTLKEVIDYLKSPDPNLVLDASGYLQHLTFNNDLIKEETRNYEATGALWNISSADELKEPILNQTAEAVIRHAQPTSSSSIQINRNPVAIVFRNGTGILRNISAVNDRSRRFLRSTPGLVETLLNFLHFATLKNQLDTRSCENVICLLRNLSYRIQEVVDSKYDPNKIKYSMMKEKENFVNGGQLSPRSNERSKSAPSGSPKLDITPNKKGGKFFSRRRKKSEIELSNSNNNENVATSISGPQLLWNPSTIRLYLKILEESANCEILEASAAAIQNLAGCPFYGSLLVRETVRIEKGLPILVELLRLREDRRNLELIGKFALSDILIKIPTYQELELIKEHPQQQQQQQIPSDSTLNAILGILWEIVRLNSEMAKLVHSTIEVSETTLSCGYN
uniref:Fibronectin type-III domain-containing protein n=1 Tax=Meloidogyne floridensis TaxID=298350 RepID=A0A915NQH1_9BILA